MGYYFFLLLRRCRYVSFWASSSAASLCDFPPEIHTDTGWKSYFFHETRTDTGWQNDFLCVMKQLLLAISWCARILGECLTIYSLRAFFFFLMEISSCTLMPLFRPGSFHSGSASRDDCNRVFPDELRVSSVPDSFPTLCLDSVIVSPLRLRWVKVYACLGITCRLHFWQNDRGLLRATPVTRGWNGHVNSGEENSPAAPAGIRTRNFSITSPAL